MPDLPPTPKPGEVWENDDGGRLFIIRGLSINGNKSRARSVNTTGIDQIADGDAWLGWAIRTNARVVLTASPDAKAP